MAKKKGIWMNGMTCLTCGEGFYNGYSSSSQTRPCNKCGDVRPAKMTLSEFNDTVAKRNKKNG